MNIRQMILNIVSIFSALCLLFSPPFVILILWHLNMADYSPIGYIGFTIFLIFLYMFVAFMPVVLNIAWHLIKKEKKNKKDILFLVFCSLYLFIASPLILSGTFLALTIAAIFIGNKLMGKVKNWIKVALASIPVIGIIVCSIYMYFFYS